jgi:hypothetical protein
MVGRGVWLDDIRSVVKEKLHNNLTPSFAFSGFPLFAWLGYNKTTRGLKGKETSYEESCGYHIDFTGYKLGSGRLHLYELRRPRSFQWFHADGNQPGDHSENWQRSGDGKRL